MRQTHVLTVLTIFAVTGYVNYFHSPAEAWQGNVIKNLNGMMTNAANVNDYQHRGRSERESLIHKVGADAYSGMGMSGADAARSQQGPMPGDQPRRTGEYNYGPPSNEARYSTKPSDPSHKESSASPASPYSGTIYGGVPTTPSADPLIRELNRDPSIR